MRNPQKLQKITVTAALLALIAAVIVHFSGTAATGVDVAISLLAGLLGIFGASIGLINKPTM